MKAYLIINLSNSMIPYKEQYQVIRDKKKAIEHLFACGYEDPYHMGLNDTIGVLNTYRCGEVNVSIMPIEIQ